MPFLLLQRLGFLYWQAGQRTPRDVRVKSVPFEALPDVQDGLLMINLTKYFGDHPARSYGTGVESQGITSV